MSEIQSNRLAGKVCVVTGAAGGIGRGTALRLAAEGARVACVDREGAEAVVAEIGAAGGTSAGFVTDVTSLAAMEAMGAEVADRWGGIDFAFANAGLPGAGSVLTVTEDHWHKVIAVNLTGVLFTMRAVAPAMIARGGGSILATASVAAFVAYEDAAAYAASKGGVIALARQAAVDLGRHGIRVNTIAPGMVPTNFLDTTIALRGGAGGIANASRETIIERTAQSAMLGRVGTPDDIASLVVFLASDESRWITGQTITIDGGASAR